MVCIVCRNMLGCQEGRYAKGTHGILYNHHKSAQTFQQAVDQDCYICRALYVSLLGHLHVEDLQSRQNSGATTSPTIDNRAALSSLAQQSFNSEASLFLEEPDRTYRLEIRSKLDQVSFQHTFHLDCHQGSRSGPNRRSVHINYQTSGTGSARPNSRRQPSFWKNLKPVHRWTKACECYAPPASQPFPTRLLSLGNVKAYIEADHTLTASQRSPTIRLVETVAKGGTSQRGTNVELSNMHYVTLSHCWGQVKSLRLLKENYEEFEKGIPVDDLPKTFQDAVYFAASLDQVGCIWIDSLCIVQDDRADWKVESVKMDRVYSNSFLNLSATASWDSHGGLFKEGEFELLQEEEVIIDIEGLPSAYDRAAVPRCPHERSCFFKRRCTIVDTTFWDMQVNKGPVNTRGWVLQERLMSSRVLHFCHNQIGWECACHAIPRVAADCRAHRPRNSANHSRAGGNPERIRQRLLASQSGPHPSSLTINSPIDLWAAVVNAYTKTRLTYSTDKLVALSGLAKTISREMNCDYFAGLWKSHLVSQLLWYIEPSFDQRDRTFSNPGEYDPRNSAPSFSWAAVDVAGHGVAYPVTSNQKLFVTVQDTVVDPPSNDPFGAVTSARVTLHGKLRKARLTSIPNSRFAWNFVGGGDLDAEPHTNNYLDCPVRDADCIDAPDAHVYILPVAEEIVHGGTSKTVYFKCLILRAGREVGTFKRVGITKLSQPKDRKALTKVETRAGGALYNILAASTSDASLPHAGYDERIGMHRLHLV